MLSEALDYREECETLHALLRNLAPASWDRPTQFKHWTFNDVIRHLHLFDHAAKLTLQDPEAFKAWLADFRRELARGRSMADIAASWLEGCGGEALLARWVDCHREVSDAYVKADPSRRVTWAGPDMSVRSSISARQMETWAHGQELFDALGQTRVEGDRIRNIAVMGVNTFGWSFSNRRLPLPAAKPYLRLVSPSGQMWEWNEPSATERIEGSVIDFCRVVAQTRNIQDTQLVVTGEIARTWMSIAQCFAGAPETPPAPGTRFPAAVSDQRGS
jgi:uncharacterized protein (TIGR03084 family)